MVVVKAEYEGKSLKKEFRGSRRSGQFGTCWNRKMSKKCPSTSTVLQGSKVTTAKTDIRHWLRAVFTQKYTRNGVAHDVLEWAIKIQHMGRREMFPLGTANRAAAAAKGEGHSDASRVIFFAHCLEHLHFTGGGRPRRDG